VTTVLEPAQGQPGTTAPPVPVSTGQ
jgi:hypothetical protein